MRSGINARTSLALVASLMRFERTSTRRPSVSSSSAPNMVLHRGASTLCFRALSTAVRTAGHSEGLLQGTI